MGTYEDCSMLFTIAMRSVLTPSSVIYFYFANLIEAASS